MSVFLTDVEHGALTAAIDNHRQYLVDNACDPAMARSLAALDRATDKLTLARQEHRL